MIEESYEPREFSKRFNLPQDPRKVKTFAKKLIQPYRFVLIMGLSCTGKSTFMEAYPGRKNWTNTKWCRDKIMNMLFTDGKRTEKYYNYIDTFEKKVLPKLAERETHQLLIEGWMRKKQRRSFYLNMFPEGLGRKLCVVFDGPVESIIKRNIQEGRLKSIPEKEVPVYLKRKHNSIDWPKFDEGFNDIFYINTFDIKGVNYLKKRLVDSDMQGI